MPSDLLVLEPGLLMCNQGNTGKGGAVPRPVAGVPLATAATSRHLLLSSEEACSAGVTYTGRPWCPSVVAVSCLVSEPILRGGRHLTTGRHGRGAPPTWGSTACATLYCVCASCCFAQTSLSKMDQWHGQISAGTRRTVLR